MPLLLFGLPTHILVVHAVVVLVPLAALGVVVIAVWPRARRRFGWLVLGVTAVAAVSIPIATSAGEALEHALPRSAARQVHPGRAEGGADPRHRVRLYIEGSVLVRVSGKLTPA